MLNSLRFRLTVIFIGLAVGPLILVGAIVGLRSYASLEQQGLALQREIAARVGGEIRACIEGRENELILLDEAYGLGIREPKEQRAILSSMLLYQHAYQEVVLLNSEGQEQIRLSRTRVILDDDLQSRAGNEEFLYPATRGETYFSPVRFDETIRQPLVTISVPLFDQRSGEIVSVLVADLRFKKIWDLLAAIELPNGGRAYVVDRAGQVVAHRNPSVVLRGATIDLPETDGHAEGLSGTDVIVARDILQFGNQELIVLAEQPVSTALELATNSIRIAVAATSVALVSAVILVVLTTRQIVRPIEALATSAQAISSGDFSQQVLPPLLQDEIAHLARTFNFMARALQEREEALQAQNEALQAEIAERKRAEEALRREHELAEALEEATAALTATLDFEQVLDRILEQVSRIVPNDATNIMLIEGDQARVVRWRGYDRFGEKEFVSTVVFRIPEVPGLQQMMESAEPIVIPDTATYPGWVRVPVTEWVRSYAAAPIIVRGEVIGFLNVDSATPGFFTQAHAETLRAFADHAAAAIENARLYEGEQERRHIAETLRQASTVLNSTLELDEVLRLILQQLRQVIPYDSASVQRLQDAALSPSTEFIPSEAEGLRTGLAKGEHLKIVACQGFEEPGKVVGLVFALDPKFPNYRVVTTKAPLAIQDVTQDYPHFKDEADTYESGRIRSWLGVPLIVKDELIGMIAVDREEVHPYTAEESQLAMAFANQAAIAIENARLFEETRRRALQLKTVEEVGRRVSSILDLDELFPYVTKAIQRNFGYHHVDIFLVEPATGYAVFKASSDPALEKAWREQGLRFKIGEEGMIGLVAHTGEPLLANDVSQEPHYLPDELLPETKSELVVPLKVEERVVGVLDVDSDQLDAFDEDNLFVLQTLANQIAIAIENARLHEETQRLKAFNESIVQGMNEGIVVEDVEGSLTYVNPSTTAMLGYSRKELLGQHWTIIVPPDQQAIVQAADERRKRGEADRYEIQLMRKDGTRVPVLIGGSPWFEEGRFAGTLAVFTDITARKRMEETLRALSLIDELTGLYNRRGFFNLAEQQLKMADRTKRRMFVVFADVDHLKRINDALGHREGDLALIEVANVLKETFRESDIIARIGGDEFVVLPIETDSASAEVLTTRLQENLGARKAEGGRRYKLSLSVGIARYDPESPCSIDALLAEADRAMYEQKQGE